MGFNLSDLSGVGTAVTGIKDILHMFFPDKTEEEKTKLAAVMAMMQGQLDINKVEAANPSTFVSGWRPAVGWVCVISLGMIYIPKALVMTLIWVYQSWIILHGWSGVGAAPVVPPYPDLGVSDLIGLLMSLLGMAGLRSLDKSNGVASK